MAETYTLKHVNVPPAQTWNYLKINEMQLTVPTAPQTDVIDVSPFADIETGAGAEASAWLLASAEEHNLHMVSAGETKTVLVVACGCKQAVFHDVLVGKSANAKIAVLATGKETYGIQLRVSLDEGAHAQVELFVAGGDDSVLLCNEGYRLADDASLEVNHHVLTFSTAALGTCIACDGANSTAELTCRNLVAGGTTLDMNYLLRQRGRLSRSHIDVSGVLAEGSNKNLCDTIDLIRGCKGAKALENEVVLLAGERMVNKSLPTILCDEDDVAGNHGATIGSVAPEQLEYLAERGLTPDEVTDLFRRSVVEDALAHARALGQTRAVAAVLAASERILGPEATAELRENA